ncbi:MAG TPA: hypothetical protein PLP29_12665 [Candidatus Ozemobacteraceae bacterium]|nr:hypothetical protein [Candidatus Ozemobacteraceae bacterium]
MSETRFGRHRRGQGLGLLILLLVGGIAIWFGYGVYVERYYIALFDGDMVRYLDVPPYGKRLTPERDELRGHVEMTLETVPDQVCNFFGLLSTKRGYILRRKEAAIEIEIRPGYVVKGLFKDNRLTLDWNPVLNESRKARKAKLESEGKLPAGSVASATAMPGGLVNQGS